MTDQLPATTSAQTLGRPVVFTPALQAQFCEHLAAHGNVRLAARACAITRMTAYRQRRASPTFDALWQAALVLPRSEAEEVLADRALNGVEEKVFYHGEEVATRTRHDGRLLLAHLGRLDRLARDRKVSEAAMFFDEMLDDLRGEAGEEFQPQDSVTYVT